MATSDSTREQEAQPGERRSFLKRLWAWLGLILLAEGAAVAFSFLRPKRRQTNEGKGLGLVQAGPVEGFEKNSVTAFRQGQFYLVRLADGAFLALSSKCTHLGCTVPWTPEKQNFACPCHGSVFDMQGGVVQAPAPRPLDRFSLRIEKNIVVVDTASPLRRQECQPADLVYPEKA